VLRRTSGLGHAEEKGAEATNRTTGGASDGDAIPERLRCLRDGAGSRPRRDPRVRTGSSGLQPAQVIPLSGGPARPGVRIMIVLLLLWVD